MRSTILAAARSTSLLFELMAKMLRFLPPTGCLNLVAMTLTIFC